jgi:hypothetical protein
VTDAECKKLVAVLLGAFPQSRISAQTPAIYERMLIDLECPAAHAAVERLLAASRFMPSVAEIREAALTLAIGEQKPGGEAWGGVLRAIKAEGAWHTPGRDFVFADTVTAECVESLGWRELCASENQVADRARFIELYDRLAVQNRQRQLSESLPAAQRYKAIQAERTGQLEAGGDAFGRVLSLVKGDS